MWYERLIRKLVAHFDSHMIRVLTIEVIEDPHANVTVFTSNYEAVIGRTVEPQLAHPIYEYAIHMR